MPDQPNDLEPVHAELAQGNLIGGIRELRRLRKLSLSDAKAQVEAMIAADPAFRAAWQERQARTTHIPAPVAILLVVAPVLAYVAWRLMH